MCFKKEIEEIKKIILNERKKTGLFFGLSCIDLTYYSDDLYPERNSKLKISDYELRIGGPAANAALVFKMLGNTSILVTSIGNSAPGKILKLELEKRGITVIDLTPQRKMPDIASIFVENTTGSRTVFSGQGKKEYENVIIPDELVKLADIIEYDGNLYGIEDNITLLIKKYNKTTVLDMGSFKEGFDKFKIKNVIAVSSKEYKNPDGSTVLDNYKDYRFCAITNEEKDIEYIKDGEPERIAVKQTNVIDTLGAGDVLHGAFMHFLLNESDIVRALAKASEFASVFVSYKGLVNGINQAIKILNYD